MAATDVLVVGAGPTGLTLANVLARSGVAFRIIDERAGPVVESRALVMHAKSLELLAKLGLADRAVAEGRRLTAFELFKAGKPAGTISLVDDAADGRTPFPFALIYEQHRTERLLLDGFEAAGGRVDWNTELVGLAPIPGGARATLRRPGGDDEHVDAGWVVGSDGASSSVRHALGLGFAGGTYEQVFYLADVDLEWALGADEVVLELTRLGFLGFFPMPGERQFRLLGVLPPELAGADALTLDDLRRLVAAESHLDVDIQRARWSSVYHIHHRMAERFRVGRAFLVGDAAHIHSPAGGQGMNTGIGDAFNLGWKLALVVKGQAHETLLASYEAERMPFARAILAGSDRGFALQVTKNPTAAKLKLLAVPALFRFVSWIRPARRRVFWLISQLWTTYRGSPAVATAKRGTKGPLPGDRAPFGVIQVGPDAGGSVFATLTGPDHHLLVFEGSRPDAARLAAAREEIDALLSRFAAPIAVQPIAAANRELHDRYGAERAIVVLVRPDGHVAYRGAAADVVGLKLFLDRCFTRRAPAGGAVP